MNHEDAERLRNGIVFSEFEGWNDCDDGHIFVIHDGMWVISDRFDVPTLYQFDGSFQSRIYDAFFRTFGKAVELCLQTWDPSVHGEGDFLRIEVSE